jgi:hypothetical protein
MTPIAGGSRGLSGGDYSNKFAASCEQRRREAVTLSRRDPASPSISSASARSTPRGALEPMPGDQSHQEVAARAL